MEEKINLPYAKMIKKSKSTGKEFYLVLGENKILFLTSNDSEKKYRIVFGSDRKLYYLKNNMLRTLSFSDDIVEIKSPYSAYRELERLVHTEEARTVSGKTSDGEEFIIEFDADSFDEDLESPTHFWFSFKDKCYDVTKFESDDGEVELEIKELSPFRIPGKVIKNKTLEKSFFQAFDFVTDEISEINTIDAEITDFQRGFKGNFELPPESSSYEWGCWCCGLPIDGEEDSICRCKTCLHLNHLKIYEDEW